MSCQDEDSNVSQESLGLGNKTAKLKSSLSSSQCLAGGASRLREIAADLHINNYEKLTVKLSELDPLLTQLSPSESYRLEGCNLTFRSMAERNKLAAEHYFYSCNTREDEHKLLSTAYQLWRNEITSEDTASGRFLALCHSEADVFQIAASVINSNKMRPYDVLHVIEKSVNYISDIPVLSLIKLYNAQFEHTRNDLAGDLISDSLRRRLQDNEELCRMIISEIRANPTLGISNLYTVAALSWICCSKNNAVRRLIDDTSSDNPIIAMSSTWAIGRALIEKTVDQKLIDDCLGAVTRNANSPDEQVRRSAIRSIVSLSPSFDNLAEITSALLRKKDRISLEAMSSLLFMRAKELETHSRFQEWLESLSALPIDATAALRDLDFVLSRLIKNEKGDIAIAVLEQWILLLPAGTLEENVLMKVMDSTIHEIIENKAVFSQILTRWLLHERLVFPGCITSIISRVSFDYEGPIKFDEEIVSSLDQAGLILLARRMLGYVFFEKTLVDLTLSLFESKSNKDFIASLVQGLLCEEIGIDFPSETLESVKGYAKKSGDRTMENIKNNVVSALTKYLDALDGLPRINELKPSPRMVEAFSKAQAKAMNRNREKSEEESIFRQIATCIPLKAGRASFSFDGNNYTGAFPLQSHSVSITLPRRTVMDKVGHELTSFLFRVSQREEK